MLWVMLRGGAGLFERAVALDKTWEKGYFSYAVYLDQLMRDARQRQTASTASRSSAKAMDRLGGRSRYSPQLCFPAIASFWKSSFMRSFCCCQAMNLEAFSFVDL